MQWNECEDDWNAELDDEVCDFHDWFMVNGYFQLTNWTGGLNILQIYVSAYVSLFQNKIFTGWLKCVLGAKFQKAAYDQGIKLWQKKIGKKEE